MSLWEGEGLFVEGEEELIDIVVPFHHFSCTNLKSEVQMLMQTTSELIAYFHQRTENFQQIIMY